MESEAEQAGIGPWNTFFIVVSAMILIALSAAIFGAYRIETPIETPIEASMVRVANGTGLPLQRVSINGMLFGNVPVDSVSSYQALKPAYRYAAFRLEVAGKKFEMVPDDYLGETPLGPGMFTYRIQREYHNGDMYFTAQDAIRDAGAE